jgi:hypothetical protein
MCSIDKWTTTTAVVLTTKVTMPPGKGHSKRNKLYYDISKGYVGSISHTRKVIKDYCLVAFDKAKEVMLCC